MSPTLAKTLVFSDLITDTVNRAASHRLDASGKGINVSRVLTQLGNDCIHLTQLGGSFRPLFLELCASDGLKVEWVESCSPIRFCYTIINRKDRTVTELVEEGEQVEEQTGERLLEAFDKLLPENLPGFGHSSLRQGFPAISTVIISGSRAAGFPDTLISEMVKRAKARSLRVILDIRGKDLLECLPWRPDIIKPNLYEFSATFAPDLVAGNEIIDTATAESFTEIKNRIAGICRDIYQKYGSNTILSRGSKAIWYAENGELFEFKVDPVEAVNSTGSGDAFTAGLAAALDEGGSLTEAVAEGARCGKLNALQLRPGVIT